jgi:hypothetical protein
MRFGGHETFTVREGWLHKGLRLLAENPALIVDENAADWLGVGRNMAKSIRHWLVATGLAEAAPAKAKAHLSLEMTPLGRLLWEKDRYLTEIGTWWALHINLVNAPQHAASWTWFFNSFGLDRFDRAVCLESLSRHLQLSRQRLPSSRTLERDIACLLSTYARTIPAATDDPEEGHDCPFRELGLLSYFRTSGYYQLHQAPKDVPPEIFGYAIARSFADATTGEGTVDITVQDAARQAGGPGRVFALTSEALFEVASRAETNARGGDIEIAGLAGNRMIRVRRKRPIEWLEQYYTTKAERERHVA